MNPIGYYIGSEAVCVDDYEDQLDHTKFPATINAIFRDTEGDTPTHCSVCEKLIPHALTSYGYAYVAEELANHFIDNTQGRPAILKQWWNEYGYWFNMDFSGLLHEKIDGAIMSWPDSDELSPK